MIRGTSLLVCLFGIVALAQADEPPETCEQLIARRSEPALQTLGERAALHQLGEPAGEAFLDLLKLREQPQPEAVPLLVEIFTRHAGSTRIHGFAAAQALFAADTDEAHEALKKQLLQPDYPADQAIMYASHWQMREPQRSQFIATYLPQNLTKDVAVSVHPHWYTDAETKLLVNLKLKNISKRRLVISTGLQQQGAIRLHLRAPSGAFAEKHELFVYEPDPVRWIWLEPGAVDSYMAALDLKEDPKSLEKIEKLVPGTPKLKGLLTSGNIGFALSEFGEYTLYAMLVQPPLPEARLQRLRETQGIEPGSVWAGRVVSPPVKVTVPPVEGQEYEE